jgi:hypothetical protein
VSARDIGPVADRAVADLLSLRDLLVREIRRALLRLDTAPGEATLLRAQARTAADVVAQVQRELAGRGVDAARLIVGERAAQAVEAAVGDAGVRVRADARREIAQIVDGQIDEIARVFQESGDEIRRAINAGVSSGANLSELVDVAADRISVAASRAQAAVDAGVMAAGRVATIRTAQALLEDDDVEGELAIVYVYEGPRDQLTRPFCRPLIGRAFTEGAIARLDNGQGLDPAAFCGGYNCRHLWIPTTLQEAQRQGIEIVG